MIASTFQCVQYHSALPTLIEVSPGDRAGDAVLFHQLHAFGEVRLRLVTQEIFRDLFVAALDGAKKPRSAGPRRTAARPRPAYARHTRSWRRRSAPRPSPRRRLDPLVHNFVVLHVQVPEQAIRGFRPPDSSRGTARKRSTAFASGVRSSTPERSASRTSAVRRLHRPIGIAANTFVRPDRTRACTGCRRRCSPPLASLQARGAACLPSP